VEIISCVKASFDAAHRVENYELCSFGDGHTWTVYAFVTGELDPKTGWVHGSVGLPLSLERICHELDRANLDSMMPGVVSTPLGIAANFLERLALQYPRLSAVRVECSDGTAGEIRRTPRQL
jgi:6-pyruvoyl-tetrahydropterin synthase